MKERYTYRVVEFVHRIRTVYVDAGSQSVATRKMTRGEYDIADEWVAAAPCIRDSCYLVSVAPSPKSPAEKEAEYIATFDIFAE